MPVDVSGFVTPEQNFGGLYKLSQNVEQKRLRDEELQRQQQSKKISSDKYFTNYLDPKDRFTGTKFDPEVNKLLGEALQQAYDLSAKGVNDTEIFTAISPLVNKVNDYSQKAQAINAQKKQAIELLKGHKGIDLNKFSSEFDNTVFGGDKMKDLSSIDPNFNYADEVLKNGNIYNNEGFDDYVAKSGKNTTVEDVSVYNKDKSMRRTKAEMTMPSFMISEKDERGAHTDFVPKYDIATDGDQPIMHDFLNKEGITETAPVRLVSQDVFNSLPPNTKMYLRQEAKKYAQENNIDVSSPAVENFAKALAYDELKRSAKQYSTLKEIQTQKAAPTIINNRINTPKETTINDVAGDIANEVDRAGGTSVASTLSNGDVIWDNAKKRGFDVKSPDDIKVVRKDGDTYVQVTYPTHKIGKDGKPEIDDKGYYVTEPKTTEYKLNSKKINIESTPGVKGKTEVIKSNSKKDPLGIL